MILCKREKASSLKEVQEPHLTVGVLRAESQPLPARGGALDPRRAHHDAPNSLRKGISTG